VVALRIPFWQFAHTEVPDEEYKASFGYQRKSGDAAAPCVGAPRPAEYGLEVGQGRRRHRSTATELRPDLLRFPMKNTKHSSGKKSNPSTQQRRASALRVLRDAALKSVTGGSGGGPPPPSTDPIC
jgi:hypothetical protein